MDDKPRYQYRFSQYQKALERLSEAVDDIQNLNRLEQEGLIQRYEFTFELAWKMLKDYLNNQGFDVTSPRQTLKMAFQESIIQHGDKWMIMLDNRNLMAHTYNEDQFEKAISQITTSFITELVQLKNSFESL